jgi:hypothetical protein
VIYFVFSVDISADCGILFAVMRDKNKAKTVKLRGPNGTTKEISLEEWNSYTPLNALANHTADSYARIKALTTKP